MSCLARTTAAAGAVLGPAAAGADALVGRLPGAARSQRESLHHLAHRPWALPDARWVMAQSWVDLLFCHWPVDEDQLRPHVPASLPLDRFDDRAWLSITPFEVQGTRPRGALPPPVLSRFPELNVRTYVVRDGRPGVWFFSLDAASALAVRPPPRPRPPPRGACPACRTCARGCASPATAGGSTTAASVVTRAARRRASTPATAPPAASATRSPARSRRGSSSATASTPSTTPVGCSSATSTTARGRCRTPCSTCGRTR